MAQKDPRREPDRDARLFVLMLGVFLGGGLLASVETLVVPQLKLTLHIGFAEALLVQLFYYSGYLIFAWPAAHLVARTGPMRSTAIGLGVMSVGCALLALAEIALVVAPLLAALFLLSAGVTVLQIGCNGVMATRSGNGGAAARFTLLQAYNALGTTLGPLVGAAFLLGTAPAKAPVVVFLAFAIGFGTLALAFVRDRRLLGVATTARIPTARRLSGLLGQPRMRRGVAAIFVYVGAEVTIGTLAVSYLMSPNHSGASAVTAGRLVSLYWGGAMIGRFAGARALARFGAARVLRVAAVGAIVLVAIAVVADGATGSTALLAIGLCNSVMFPTIYALAMPDDAVDMPGGAMLLCMAVVGGAVVPMLTGLAADRTTLAWALMIPLACYVAIAAFAWNFKDTLGRLRR